MAACYKCGKPITLGGDGPVPDDAVCEQCSSWLHCCANCTYYDEYSYTKCREAKAEFVFDRVGRNACRFFRLKAAVGQGERQRKMSPRGEEKEREGRARDNLAKLFRK